MFTYLVSLNALAVLAVFKGACSHSFGEYKYSYLDCEASRNRDSASSFLILILNREGD